jgi:aminoglycoside phosphotransferase (APT) family kinase protein
MQAESQPLPVREVTLSTALERALDHTVRAMRVTPLGASSRETPWRVDLETDRGGRRLLVRLGPSCSANEVAALAAMEDHSLPTPKTLHWDPEGKALGIPLFVSTFIEGEPLLDAMKAGEPWADALYIDTVCAVQSITAADLPPGSLETLEGSESALQVLEAGYAMFEKPNPLAEAAYERLKATWPGPPGDRFSNGDLWPENLLVEGDRLVGIIDWQHAGFTDPIFEFLLPFFLVPELRDRGTEQAYCERMGFDETTLHWYHGLEFFDSLRWVLKTGEPYEIHTAESLERDLERWLKKTLRGE